MKRAFDQVDPGHAAWYDPHVVAWKCVAERVALQRNASAFWRIVCSVPAIGRMSVAAKSASNDEYCYWVRFLCHVQPTRLQRVEHKPSIRTGKWLHGIDEWWSRHDQLQLHRRLAGLCL